MRDFDAYGPSLARWLALAPVVLVACGDADFMASDGGSVARDGGSGVDAGFVRDGGLDDAGLPLALGDLISGVIAEPGEVDAYPFDVVGGQLIEIVASAPRIGDHRSELSPIIQLLDTSGTLVAESYDKGSRGNEFVELLFHVPATRRYVVTVQDNSSWRHLSPERGGPTFFYRLGVNALVAWPGTTLDEERGDDASSAVLAVPSAGRNRTVGAFRDAEDVDVYRIEDAALGDAWRLIPTGPHGNGSTDPGGRIWLTTLDGATVLASIDPSADYRWFIAPRPGSFLIWVAPDSDPGENGFYTFHRFRRPGAIAEPNEGTNDDIAGARHLDLTALQGSFAENIRGTLGPGDVDYFAYDVQTDVFISGLCAAGSFGSGVRGFRAELRDPNGVVLVTNAERDNVPIELGTRTTTAGVHLLRVTARDQDPEVVGTHYDCSMVLVD